MILTLAPLHESRYSSPQVILDTNLTRVNTHVYSTVNEPQDNKEYESVWVHCRYTRPLRPELNFGSG